MMLAAGPDRIVSTGSLDAASFVYVPPSGLEKEQGEATPSLARASPTEFTNLS
jgi:hypothetical protein